MTQSEFQAWFEGFCAALDGPPTAEQWVKVCERVEGLEERPDLVFRPHVSDNLGIQRWQQPLDWIFKPGMTDCPDPVAVEPLEPWNPGTVTVTRALGN